jgi:maleylpyruvate isomerase
MILYGFWRSSATWRVRIGLQLKKLDYQLRSVNLAGEQHRPEYAAQNPLRQVPLLVVDGPAGPFRLTQSMAILEYLEERWPSPPLLPADPLLRARARQLAEMVNSGIQPLQNASVSERVKTLGGDAKAWIEHWVTRGLDALEPTVKETAGRYSIGDAVTLADVTLIPELGFARRFLPDLSRWPTLVRIGEECARLEPFQRAAPERQPDAPPP